MLVICTIEFDLLEAGFRHWGFVLAPLMFVLIGACIFFLRRGIGTRVFSAIYALFGLILALDGIYRNYGEYKRYEAAYKAGEYSVVEGRVENFHEEGVGARRVKYGTVGGQEFKIDGPATITNGYNEGHNTSEPIESGRYVRIWHIDGDIIRLESCV